MGNTNKKICPPCPPGPPCPPCPPRPKCPSCKRSEERGRYNKDVGYVGYRSEEDAFNCITGYCSTPPDGDWSDKGRGTRFCKNGDNYCACMYKCQTDKNHRPMVFKCTPGGGRPVCPPGYGTPIPYIPIQ